MVFANSGWKQGVLGYVAWTLMPYAIMILVRTGLCLFRMHPPALKMLAWTIIITALGGPLLYIDALFVHVDAQGALVILMIPVIQTGFILVAVVAIIVRQWCISRRMANAASQAGGKASFPILATSKVSSLRKSIYMTLITIIFMAALLYAAISMLQSSDAETIVTAKTVDAFIRQYCESKKYLPSAHVLRERFPGLNTNAGWFFFTDDKTYLQIQYPMQWWNGDALGVPKISEFTATPYAYGVDYHCGDGK
jgi:hypothetical protein